MKKLLLSLIVFALITPALAQKKAKLHLTNALVVAQLDDAADRYSLEINMTEMLSSAGIKTLPSLNILKMGSDAMLLTTDSLKQVVKAKGVDTYLVISVRGYDRKFKVSDRQEDLVTALSAASLFDLYRADIVSISFEFKFFRDGQFVYGDIIKCGNISDRETVLKRFRNKVEKRIVKKWKK